MDCPWRVVALEDIVMECNSTDGWKNWSANEKHAAEVPDLDPSTRSGSPRAVVGPLWSVVSLLRVRGPLVVSWLWSVFGALVLWVGCGQCSGP